jgi:hypothetical protein
MVDFTLGTAAGGKDLCERLYRFSKVSGLSFERKAKLIQIRHRSELREGKTV